MITIFHKTLINEEIPIIGPKPLPGNIQPASTEPDPLPGRYAEG